MQIRKLAVAAVLIAGALPLSMRWTFAHSPARMQAAEDATLLSAAMLRRIAEAADGYRTGRSVWFLIRDSEPYDIVGVFTDRYTDRLPPGTRLVGPYLTPPDNGHPAMFVPVRHTPPTRYGRDTLPSWRFPPEPWAMDDIDSIVITAFHRRGGAPWRASSPGRDIDAVFFTLAANDKFVFPYYARVSGLDVAKRMRDNLLAYVQGSH